MNERAAFFVFHSNGIERVIYVEKRIKKSILRSLYPHKRYGCVVIASFLIYLFMYAKDKNTCHTKHKHTHEHIPPHRTTPHHATRVQTLK